MDTDSSESNVIPIPAFIRGVVELAHNQADVDTRLLNILEKHILTDSPANGSVHAATKEIESLAEERAQTCMEKNGAQKNGGSNQD